MAAKPPPPDEVSVTTEESAISGTDTDPNSTFESESELESLTIQFQAEFLKILDESKVDETIFKTIDQEECEQVVTDEKVVLTSIYEIVKFLSKDERTFEVALTFGNSNINKKDEISITFQLPPDYPNSIPIFEINNSESQILTFSDTDSLYDKLLLSALDQRGGPMVYNLLQLAHESCEVTILSKKNKKLDQSLYEQASLFTPVPSHKPPENNNTEIEDKKKPEEFSPSSFISIHQLIKQCRDHGYKIGGIENILRSDLAKRFIATQRDINSLAKNYKRARNFSNTLEIVYHGTAVNNLPSIVTKGLLMPGTEGVRVVNGSAFGVGIYVGTSPVVSLSYSNSSKLLVCALIPGLKSTVMSGTKYQIYDGGTFYVVKNASQLLPCYVVNLIYNQEQVNELATLSAAIKTTTNTHSLDSTENNSEHDRQELLEARMRKFLPFGFGPGERTVVLEAGDWDDDDDAIVEGRTQDADIIFDYGLVQQETTELQHYRHVDKHSEGPAQSKSRYDI